MARTKQVSPTGSSGLFGVSSSGEAEIKGFGPCQLYVLDAPAAGALELR
jgi:hypothetical protein